MMEAYRLVCLAALMMLLGPAVTLPAFAQQAGRPEEPCLEVQVLDPSSASIQGAAVTIGDREERTDSSGVATICDLVSARKPLYRSFPVTIHHTFRASCSPISSRKMPAIGLGGVIGGGPAPIFGTRP